MANKNNSVCKKIWLFLVAIGVFGSFIVNCYTISRFECWIPTMSSKFFDLETFDSSFVTPQTSHCVDFSLINLDTIPLDSCCNRKRPVFYEKEYEYQYDKCYFLRYLDNEFGNYFVCGPVRNYPQYLDTPPYHGPPTRNVNCSLNYQEVENTVNQDFERIKGPPVLIKLFFSQFLLDCIIGAVVLFLNLSAEHDQSTGQNFFNDSGPFFLLMLILILCHEKLDSVQINKKGFLYFFVWFEMLPIVIFFVNLQFMPFQYFTIVVFGKVVLVSVYKLVTTVYEEYWK